MEVEKKQAVENEDYDKAQVKKLQADEYRLQIYSQLNIQDLLEVSGVGRNSQECVILLAISHTRAVGIALGSQTQTSQTFLSAPLSG